MILPQSYSAVMFLMVLSLLCLGSWATAFKLGGKWRFEVFYLDFAIGLLLAAVVYAFTFGNLGYDGFNFMDDLQHAGKRQWMYVFMSGIIFNLGNMLLMGAVSVAGLAVAFPMGMGIAVLIGTVLGFAGKPAGNPRPPGTGTLRSGRYFRHRGVFLQFRVRYFLDESSGGWRSGGVHRPVSLQPEAASGGVGQRRCLVHRYGGGAGCEQHAGATADWATDAGDDGAGITGDRGALGNAGLPRIQDKRHPREGDDKLESAPQ